MRNIQRNLLIQRLNSLSSQEAQILYHKSSWACPHVVWKFSHNEMVEWSLAQREFRHLHVFLSDDWELRTSLLQHGLGYVPSVQILGHQSRLDDIYSPDLLPNHIYRWGRVTFWWNILRKRICIFEASLQRLRLWNYQTRSSHVLREVPMEEHYPARLCRVLGRGILLIQCWIDGAWLQFHRMVPDLAHYQWHQYFRALSWI